MIRRLDTGFGASALAATMLAGAAPAPAELAGRALDAYPHFEFVRSIPETDAVLLAVDPSRHPRLAGVRAAVWVVAHRTAAQWASDPALADARPGGPQVLAFGAGSIRANTFTLAAPGELASRPTGPGAPALGAGYDVVIDLDGDGMLSDGDVIDGGGTLSTPGAGAGAGAGFYLVHDTTQPGPHEICVVEHSGGPLLTQRTFYPEDVASMGRLPLVAVGHGWTHTYQMYDHIGRHLASYGYVVTAFTNDCGAGNPAGTETAALTTLRNTDYFIGAQSTIAGGVLSGHVDSSRIVWIGHSTGAEAVVRAYSRLAQGYVPDHYRRGDVVLISSICPVNWLSRSFVDPAEVAYHMFVAGADTDTTGQPSLGYFQSMTIYERARGERQLVYVHGAGHNDFHAGDQNPFASGPDLIGKEATNLVAKGYYLPLVELYTRNNPAALDFFARRADVFRPLGIPDNVVLSNEHRAGQAAGAFVIDDYESQPDPGTSSSGGVVTFTLAAVAEILMRDHDDLFAWTGFQTSNGMTRSRFADDLPHCAVFDWSPGDDVFYELEIVPAERDLRDDAFLSFRACQGTRHPRTTALNGPLSFTVTLRDGAGGASSIATASYGAIIKPYPRTGFGPGAGWGNEFETIRIPLDDFRADGSGLDLGDVVAVRFELGAAAGSAQGRIGLDDVEIVRRPARAEPRLEISLPGGAPARFVPGRPAEIAVELVATGGEEIVAGAARVRYRVGWGAFGSAALEPVDGDAYRAVIPAAGCGARVEYYFEAEGTASGPITLPSLAPGTVFTAAVAEEVAVLDEALDADPLWTREGEWAFGAPAGRGGDVAGHPDPARGATGANVFGVNLAGDYAAAPGGPFFLIAGPVSLVSVRETRLVFQRWLNTAAQTPVRATVDVSADGAVWTTVWANQVSDFPGSSTLEATAENAWTRVELDVSELLDDEPAAYVRWRHEVVSASAVPYSGWNIDDVSVRGLRLCCAGDVNGDGTVGLADLLAVLTAWGDCPGICSADVNGDGGVGLADALAVLSAWGACP